MAELTSETDQNEERVPTVVVDDLHLTYRVYGARSGRGDAPTALKRLIRRQPAPHLREVHAVQGVSFTAYRGESIGLIGRNGSGKSTLLKAIAGLLPPDQGMVYTDGQPSLLGVNAALMNDLTGERNIVLGCLAMGMTPAEVKEKYDDIVEFSGLGDFINLPMRTYSSGMSQRLKFAIAVAKAHDVLLIDEALATGDADFRRRSEARISQLREDAGTIFLVSHGLGSILQTCSRAIWLDQGQIRMDDEAETVVRAYQAEVAERRAATRARKLARRTALLDEDDDVEVPLGNGQPGQERATQGRAGQGRLSQAAAAPAATGAGHADTDDTTAQPQSDASASTGQDAQPAQGSEGSAASAAGGGRGGPGGGPGEGRGGRGGRRGGRGRGGQQGKAGQQGRLGRQGAPGQRPRPAQQQSGSEDGQQGQPAQQAEPGQPTEQARDQSPSQGQSTPQDHQNQ